MHGWLVSLERASSCRRWRPQVILDITEYARCNDLMHDSQGNPVEANTCHVPFRFGTPTDERSGGTSGTTEGSRSKKKQKSSKHKR